METDLPKFLSANDKLELIRFTSMLEDALFGLEMDQLACAEGDLRTEEERSEVVERAKTLSALGERLMEAIEEEESRIQPREAALAEKRQALFKRAGLSKTHP